MVTFSYGTLFSRDSDNKLLPAAALTSEHSKGASSIAITALMEEKVDFYCLENLDLFVFVCLFCFLFFFYKYAFKKIFCFDFLKL
jgi:hypothetical protein